MCGRFVLTDCEERIISSFGLHNSNVVLNPRYNICPTEKIPVIVQDDGLLNLEFMQWGFVPFWSDGKTPLINARVETINYKPSFKEAINKRRCLIPANGFYEWMQENSKKKPYYISFTKNNLFAFAGIWEEWISNNHKKIKTCAVLTSKANSFMSKIHKRMPLIINQNNIGMWFDYTERTLNKLRESSLSEPIQAWEVSEKVGSPNFDNPNCIKEINNNERSRSNNFFPKIQGELFD